jgi:hypothetical protein
MISVRFKDYLGPPSDSTPLFSTQVQMKIHINEEFAMESVHITVSNPTALVPIEKVFGAALSVKAIGNVLSQVKYDATSNDGETDDASVGAPSRVVGDVKIVFEKVSEPAFFLISQCDIEVKVHHDAVWRITADSAIVETLDGVVAVSAKSIALLRWQWELLSVTAFSFQPKLRASTISIDDPSLKFSIHHSSLLHTRIANALLLPPAGRTLVPEVGYSIEQTICAVNALRDALAGLSEGDGANGHPNEVVVEINNLSASVTDDPMEVWLSRMRPLWEDGISHKRQSLIAAEALQREARIHELSNRSNGLCLSEEQRDSLLRVLETKGAEIFVMRARALRDSYREMEAKGVYLTTLSSFFR